MNRLFGMWRCFVGDQRGMSAVPVAVLLALGGVVYFTFAHSIQ